MSDAENIAGEKRNADGAEQQQIRRRRFMFVLSSPSGAGKTMPARQLLESDSLIRRSVSLTTRQPRPTEVADRDCHFRSEIQFDAMIAHHEFIEWAEIFGHRYGSPRGSLEEMLLSRRDVLFDIDWQGAGKLRKVAGNDLVTAFILPPSIKELERRLKLRAQDTPEVIASRMARAMEQVGHWEEYDYVIVNDEADRALSQLRQILGAERLKRERRIGLKAFVHGLDSEIMVSRK
jgi:guanylate kinase